VPTVAQDGARVAQREDFLHAVRDVEDDATLRPEFADDREESFDLAHGQAARGLVERDDLGAAAERLRDLDHLSLTDRQMRELRVRIDFFAEAAEQGGRLVVQRSAIDDAMALGQVTEKNILRDGHFRHEVEFLVDHRDTGGERGGGGLKLMRAAAEENLAGGGAVCAAERLEQRRFAGTVFPHERVHRAFAHGEGDVLQRRHADVGLGDGGELEVGRVHLSCHREPGAVGRGDASSWIASSLRSSQ
jgi:hypothetical protein